MSSIERRSSKPAGYSTPASSNSRRHPVLVPSAKCLGSAPYMGMPSSSARSRSMVVVV